MDDKQASAVEELSVAACWQRLRVPTVGRLAVVVDGEPDIFPISFVADHGSIVFRTAAGTKLSASAGRAVAFEVDGEDAPGGEGENPGEAAGEDGGQGTGRVSWSVVVKGMAREVRETAEAIEVLSLPLVPVHGGPKPRLMRIEPSSVTGRLLRH